MRNVARLAAATALVAVTVMPATRAEAIYCGVLHPVCSTYCRVTYETLGWMCVA